jgi:hypothetical protein
MAGFLQAPSTPARQITSVDMDDLTRELVVPPATAAGDSSIFHKSEFVQIRADCGTEKALLTVSSAASIQRVESGRVTKRPPIPKPSTKPSKKGSLRVHFDNQPMTPKVMEPRTSPPRRPSAPRFRNLNLDFDEPPSTPDVMPEPATPSTPHSCPDPGVKCSRCVRIEQKSAKMALQPKAPSSKPFVSQVRGN